MADHVRKQIRDSVTSVVTGLTTTGSRVYQSRYYPQEESNLPGLLVYTKEENSEPGSTLITGSLIRYLSLIIEAQAQATSSLDDTLDQICKEVEVAIMNGGLITGALKDIYLASTVIEFDSSGTKPIGSASMEFVFTYLTKKNAPDTGA